MLCQIKFGLSFKISNYHCCVFISRQCILFLCWKYKNLLCEVWIEKSVPSIIFWHHVTCRVMTNFMILRNGFFYLHQISHDRFFFLHTHYTKYWHVIISERVFSIYYGLKLSKSFPQYLLTCLCLNLNLNNWYTFCFKMFLSFLVVCLLGISFFFVF